MRVSIKEDPELAEKYRATLNGHPMNLCVAADEEEGWVETFIMDANGYVVCGPIVEQEDGSWFREGPPPTVVLYGQVKLVPV